MFDLDEGQKIKELVPPGVLSPEEAQGVAFLSLADSPSDARDASVSVVKDR